MCQSAHPFHIFRRGLHGLRGLHGFIFLLYPLEGMINLVIREVSLSKRKIRA